jgi:phosphoribosylglycinamide formyltransferase 1
VRLPAAGHRPIFARSSTRPRIRVTPPARVAVLASGGGSNLQALLDRFHDGGRGVRIARVVASRAGIGALDRAARAGVPSAVVDAREPGARPLAEALLAELEGIDLVVLAGWLQLVPAAVVARFPGRMLNVHPALLPSFGGAGMYGMRVHRAVLEAGVRVTGVTVHRVDERYDEGAIVAQWPVPVLIGDTADRLAARVLAVEHRLLPLAVEAVATGREVAAEDAAEAWFDRVPGDGPGDETLRRMIHLR